MDTQKKIEELKAFEQSLEAKTLEELKVLEQEIVKEAEEADKEVSSKEFKLDKKNYKIDMTFFKNIKHTKYARCLNIKENIYQT